MDPRSTALIVVDVQKAFQDWEETGAGRNNPDAVGNIAALLDGFRSARSPIFHIRHRGAAPDSLFQGSACDVIQEAEERNGEPVLWKTVNSAFIGTGLEEMLRRQGVRTVVICGATSNHCVETTTRMAGNLGFDARFVGDATWTFDRRGPDGRMHRAQDIQAMTEANLSGEFAEIVASRDVLRTLSGGI
ncbi:cysteine hydrolase family protein [Alsobacter sp. KACC 23698]|uniref:Cysteine hydrolase family protein n=1 Tax=Alsobacter sp. KACC 23698 TaxID=3149229 RepID=A0AAU7JN59_9HYPH